MPQNEFLCGLVGADEVVQCRFCGLFSFGFRGELAPIENFGGALYDAVEKSRNGFILNDGGQKRLAPNLPAQLSGTVVLVSCTIVARLPDKFVVPVYNARVNACA
ncbi:MAG TPA: hypothetical protein VE994_08945 [Terriglobales bacterium]|nr:hypothetical protein [Terriglobales bacterium]